MRTTQHSHGGGESCDPPCPSYHRSWLESREGEQAFQVEHYLNLWKAYPSDENWRRVTEARRSSRVQRASCRGVGFTAPSMVWVSACAGGLSSRSLRIRIRGITARRSDCGRFHHNSVGSISA